MGSYCHQPPASLLVSPNIPGVRSILGLGYWDSRAQQVVGTRGNRVLDGWYLSGY